MKKSIQFVLFIVFSIIEIKVRALPGVLQKPENCLKSELPCTIGTTKNVFNYALGEVYLDLDRDTIVTKLNDRSFEFIKGTVRILSQKTTEWKVGTATIQGQLGEYWLFENHGKIWVRSILGSCEARFGNQKVQIPEGFELWLGGTDSEGHKVYSVPQVFSISDHLKNWSRLKHEPKKDFLERVENLKMIYKNNVELSSQIYKEVALRHLASEEKRKAMEENKRKEKILEQERLRRTYFQKVFEQ